MYYIYSTLTASTAYAVFTPNDPNSLPIIEKTIEIKGGANVSDKSIVTPKGVVTQVSDDDYALLEKDYHFREHVKHGFIKVEKVEAPVDRVVKDMVEKDASAPKTPEDPEFVGQKFSSNENEKKHNKKDRNK